LAEYRRVSRRAKRRNDKYKVALLLDRLKNKDPAAYGMFKKQQVKKQSPIPLGKWEQHMQGFAVAPAVPVVQQPVVEEIPRRGNTAWAREQQNKGVGASHAAPLGRRNNQVAQVQVPMPIPARVGDQLASVWMTECLEDANFSNYVKIAVSKMNACSSAGLDEMGVAFVKHANLQVNGMPGRNVLLPMLTCLGPCC
jgi:hypothetical protein